MQTGKPATDAEAFIAGLSADFRLVPLGSSDRAMLDYVDTLTRTPQAVTAADIAALRQAGFDNRAIHDICAIAAYYAFVNRIADGLGVELEPRFRAP